MGTSKGLAERIHLAVLGRRCKVLGERTRVNFTRLNVNVGDNVIMGPN